MAPRVRKKRNIPKSPAWSSSQSYVSLSPNFQEPAQQHNWASSSAVNLVLHTFWTKCRGQIVTRDRLAESVLDAAKSHENFKDLNREDVLRAISTAFQQGMLLPPPPTTNKGSAGAKSAAASSSSEKKTAARKTTTKKKTEAKKTAKTKKTTAKKTTKTANKKTETPTTEEETVAKTTARKKTAAKKTATKKTAARKKTKRKTTAAKGKKDVARRVRVQPGRACKAEPSSR